VERASWKSYLGNGTCQTEREARLQNIVAIRRDEVVGTYAVSQYTLLIFAGLKFHERTKKSY
jgi:hypothetical protein